MQRIISLADDAVVAGLQGTRDSKHPERSLMATNAVAGTYRDKRDRLDGKGDKATTISVFVGVMTNDTIEVKPGE